ncbi:hypothetical protein D3C73_1366920 [compost metagenome]
MVAHAYQQSVVETSKPNPFVDGIRWHSGHTQTTCEICKDRDNKVFDKGKLPLDHPNGKCTMIPEVTMDYTDIADEIADWGNGKQNKKLDRFSKWLGN